MGEREKDGRGRKEKTRAIKEAEKYFGGRKERRKGGREAEDRERKGKKINGKRMTE